jgi:hypothetical protein
LAIKTGDAVVLPTVILHGNFTGEWKDTDPFVAAEDKLTAALELELAEGTYDFGFKFDGQWKANGAVLTREANTTNLAEGSGNMKLTADKAGKYTIVYTFESQAVVVTYPSDAESDTIKLEFENGFVDNEYFEEYRSTDVVFYNIPVVGGQLVGDGDYLDLSIFPEDPNNITGTYSTDEEFDNFDAEYSYLIRINGTDTVDYEFVEAVAAIKIGEVSLEQSAAQLILVANLKTADGIVFTVEFANVVYYDFIDEQGLEEIMTETNGKVLKIMHEGQVYILKDNKLYNLNGQSVR